MTLGTPMQPGNDATHFARPTDVAWLPDGTFFVSDGYVNTRVVKFDKNGKFLHDLGREGQRAERDAAQLHEHRARHRRSTRTATIYVSDRANSRIQVFDENGKFLDAWPNVRRPYSFLLTEDQHLWVADGITQKFTKFDLTGKLLYSWGTFGAFPGGFWGVHQFHTDSEGNLYTADVHVGRPQKFRPKKGANPAQPDRRLHASGAPTRRGRRARTRAATSRRGTACRASVTTPARCRFHADTGETRCALSSGRWSCSRWWQCRWRAALAGRDRGARRRRAARRPAAASGARRAGGVRPVRAGAELAAAAARRPRRREARRLDLGIGRRGVRRDARSHLDRAARRAAAAGGRRAVDAVRACSTRRAAAPPATTTAWARPASRPRSAAGSAATTT